MKARLYNGWAFGIIVIIVMLALPVSSIFAQEVTSVGVFAPASVAVGAQVAVDVEVHNVENLYGYDMLMHFDPVFLSVDDADESFPGVQVQLGSFLSPDMFVINQVDLATGTVHVRMVQMNPHEPVSGSGILFTVLFRGKMDGLSPLTFSDLILTDRDGFEIIADAISSQVTVGTGISPRLYLPLVFQSGVGLMTLPGANVTSQQGDNPLIDRITTSDRIIEMAELTKK